MIVMKFGGTSVANFEAITRAVFIVGGRLNQKPVVVVSALSKVTDLLYRISDAAVSRNVSETENLMNELRSRHVNLATELLEQSPALLEAAVANVNEICDKLEALVKAICAVGELSDRNKAIIISNGELLSSTIICHTMNAKGIRTNFIDARKMIVDGAVGMVEMALARLSENNTVQLDEERKAAMVSNLLVVLCGNHDAQPVVNSGSLY